MTRNIWMITMMTAVVAMLAFPPVSAAGDGSDACADDDDAGDSWTTANGLPSVHECEGGLHASRDQDDWYVLPARAMPHYASVTVCNDGDDDVRFELHHRARVSTQDVVSIRTAAMSPVFKTSAIVSAGACETVDDTETTPGQYFIHGETLGGSGEIPYTLEIESGNVPFITVRN